jgi:hypothetical protein
LEESPNPGVGNRAALIGVKAACPKPGLYGLDKQAGSLLIRMEYSVRRKRFLA